MSRYMYMMLCRSDRHRITLRLRKHMEAMNGALLITVVIDLKLQLPCNIKNLELFFLRGEASG